MSFWRILLYGLVYWFVGAVILVLEVQFLVSRGTSSVIFFATSVLLPMVFAGLFFARSKMRGSARNALVVAVFWMVLFTLLDGLIWVRFFAVSPATYFSWYLLLEYALLAVISVGVAELVVRTKTKQGPEGLV